MDKAVDWDAALPELGWWVVDCVGGPVAGFADEAAEAGVFRHAALGTRVRGNIGEHGERVPVAQRMFGELNCLHESHAGVVEMQPDCMGTDMLGVDCDSAKEYPGVDDCCCCDDERPERRKAD